MKASKPAAPIFLLLFVSIFGFIGLTVLIFLWRSDGSFAPPVVFRIFGSFIALAFMILGFGLPLTLLFHKRRGESVDETSMPEMPAPSMGYRCPNCGAGIGKQEVSPSGDVKCMYCHRWYNIHAKVI